MSSFGFNGVSSFGNFSFDEIVQASVQSYADWALLTANAFVNVNNPTSGAYGGTFHELKHFDDPRYSSGQVWRTARANWIWEAGFNSDISPVSISGAYVNNVFVPASGDGVTFDYREGRIIFDTPIATTSTVTLEHSYKWVNVVDADEIPWLRQVAYNSHRVDNSDWATGSGDFSNLRASTVQLPTVAVEVVPKGNAGYEIGRNGHIWTEYDIKFHVIGEDKWSTTRIANAFRFQEMRALYLIDLDRLSNNNAFPLRHDGSVVNNPVQYTTMIAPTGDGGYRYSGALGGKFYLDNPVQTNSQQVNDRLYLRTITVDAKSVARMG